MSDTGISLERRRKQDTDKVETLIFFHLNKAAGTTLRSILRRKFPFGARYTVHSLDELLAIPEEERKKIKYLEGHYIWGLHEHLSQRSTHITLLRNPVDRVISEYYYLLSRPDYTSLHNELTAKNVKNLEGYIREGIWHAWNYQTGSISGFSKGSVLPYGPLPLTLKDLEAAKTNLREHFLFFGLSERFDESMVLLKRTFGWGIKDILYLRENVGQKRPPKKDISRDAIKLIEDNNKLDLELYAFARQMFEEAISRQGSSFKRDLKIFRACNKIYGMIMNNKAGTLIRLLLEMFRGETTFSNVLHSVRSGLMKNRKLDVKC